MENDRARQPSLLEPPDGLQVEFAHLALNGAATLLVCSSVLPRSMQLGCLEILSHACGNMDSEAHGIQEIGSRLMGDLMLCVSCLLFHLLSMRIHNS